jgi:3-methylcrotonyl-CoA carboxylase beta subunit
MGGEQAANVLATVMRDNLEAAGKTWTTEDEQKFKVGSPSSFLLPHITYRTQQPILDKYEKESHAYYASARLWDDGVINPAHTREILGMAFAVASKNEPQATKFGVFRM